MAGSVEADAADTCLRHELLCLTPKLVGLERSAQLINDDVAGVLIRLPGLLFLQELASLKRHERGMNRSG